jgi:phosphonate transport system substrate-binding protein
MIALAGIFSIAACGGGNNAAGDNTTGGGGGNGAITELKISAIPDADAKKIEDRSNQFGAWLSKKIGIPVKFVPSKDYAASVTALATGQIDMVWYGAVTSVQAEKQCTEGVTFVACRDIDLAFETYFIANKNTGVESIADLKALKDKASGRTFTFGSTGSTSGHVMPRWFMHKAGYKPEDVFKSVAYSGSHDKTLDQVNEGSVDFGALNFATYNAAKDERKANVNLIYKTPSYVDYVWVARNGVGADMIKKIKDAIVGLDKSNEEEAAILKSFSAKEKFVEADPAKWDECREILMANILPE